MGNKSFTEKDFGLKKGKTKSEVKTGEYNSDMLPDLSKIIGNALFIAYMYDGITIGKFEDNNFVCSKGEFNINWEQLLRLRIFNENCELHVYKTSQGLKYRLRTDDVDNVNEKTNYIEADQVLFGTITENTGNGYTKLTEDRGTEINLPFEFEIKDGAASDKRVKIKTRNYIGYIENHASYVDTRFVEFVLPVPEKEGM